ncbi:oxidoreductase [Roseofilum reptotaenium CS-1145]|uniref:Short-chain dehydrogenase/reductase n=1 Tax=Roseofilum reptotaenium AO1-A TaxID=1925591 RepID=A0A1L9QNU5_9CYAN|nr:oxidoreductase [Roseofilum reptotaenium]MDB9519368.1 oxidoreductase [Roseofilum reptotaenium CS-1145]OJJ24335.1 short-chain dehydrogenase/reductase [Roseofilum reptotaenium AO1-A]
MSQTVLITGASSGIGKETAKILIQEGYTVYATARRVEKMEDLRKLGGIPIKMDITKEDEVLATVKQIKQNYQSVDVLINNAGFGMYGTIEDTSIEDARYQFEVNLFGLARLTQLILPDMREKRGGKIVNLSSMVGKIYTPMGAWYNATKHALEAWSDCLRIETQAFNIDVIIIEPGIIGTEFGEVFIEPMLKRSGNGAYQDLAQGFAKACHDVYDNPGNSSPPSTIAKIILRAIQAKHPKTRYVAGKMAVPMMWTRKWLGDRVYDWILTTMIRSS